MITPSFSVISLINSSGRFLSYPGMKYLQPVCVATIGADYLFRTSETVLSEEWKISIIIPFSDHRSIHFDHKQLALIE